MHESNYTDLHTSRIVDRNHIIIGTPDFFQIEQGWELLVEVYILKWGTVFSAPIFTKIRFLEFLLKQLYGVSWKSGRRFSRL
jgi:hypothetical protein